MNKAMEQELNRLEKCSEWQLYKVLEGLDNNPLPDHLKKLIANKIRQVLNKRIGL